MANRGFWGLKGLFALLLTVLLLALVLPSVSAATGVTTTPTQIDLRSQNGSSFENSIIANANDPIDVQLGVFLDETTGASSTTNIPVQAYAKIEGLQTNGSWVMIGQTPTEDALMNLFETRTFNWNNIFTVQNGYSQYRVSGYSRSGNERAYNGPILAFVNRVLQNGNCSQIRINSFDVQINENDQRDFSFSSFNDSDSTFRVDSLNFSGSQSNFTIANRNSDTVISSHSSGTVRFRINSFGVDHDLDNAVSLRVSGHFDNPSLSCSESQIGYRDFTVRILNTGTSNSSICQNIRIAPFPITAIGNTSTDRKFTVFNTSTQRFFIQNSNATPSNSFFAFSGSSFDPSIPSDSAGTWQIHLNTNPISSETSGNASLQLAGNFENGTACSLNDITQNIGVTILPVGRVAACANILIEAYDDQLNENDSKDLIFRVDNSTSRRFTISSVELTEDSPDLQLTLVSKDSSIGSGQTGDIRIRASSDSFSGDQSIGATIRIRGNFDDGTTCNLTNIQAPFQIRLIADTFGNNDNGGVFDNGSTSADCSQLNLDTASVFVAGGTSNTGQFQLENNSNRTFFIENVDAYDNSDRITVTPGQFDSFVRPNDTATVSVRVAAISTTDRFTDTGFVRIAGRFANGNTCSLSSVSTRSFPVLVNSSSIDNSTSGICQDVSLTVPSTVSINQSGNVSFSVNNPTSQTAWVFLRGNGTTVSPNTFAINANRSLTFSATIQSNISGPSNLEFFVVGNDCQGQSKFARIENGSSGSFSPGGFTNDISIVFVPSETVFVKQTTVVISVKNNSSVPQTVTVSLNGFSSAWFLDKKTVALVPSETKTVYLDVFSNNRFGSFNGTVTASTSSGQTSKTIVLHALQSSVIATEIRLSPSFKTVGNNTEVSIAVSNDSLQQVQGTLQLESQEGTVIDQAALTVNPSETKNVVFTLENQRGLDAGRNLTVRFLLNDGREAFSSFAVLSNSGLLGFGTAFASLSPQSVFWGGIILVIILLLIIAWWQSKQKKSWQKMNPLPESLVPQSQSEPIATVLPATAPAAASIPIPAVTQTVTVTKVEKTPINEPLSRFWFLRRS
ncbi:MAG: hypothetical protein V1777_02350 [Candidatus Micrarchaeota archaeon]